jgi:hypothetical protein
MPLALGVFLRATKSSKANIIVEQKEPYWYTIHVQQQLRRPFHKLCLVTKVLSLVDAWTKAAVEHKTLEITYYSGRTKGETTVREVEPDYCGWSINHRNFGLWAVCRMRNDVRCFKRETVISWRYIGNSFAPNPRGRWQELVPVYDSGGLAREQF